ncbi:STAS domain-containing protein [Streptomyces sp. NPDC096934]|uniref:STAS domain-containing protein n=1 Tax=Streptomyces sp. NPDC096934 TaxID=3155551 RepID=UPI00331C799C
MTVMESSRLSVTRSTTAEGITVLALRGEIDFTTGTEVQRALLGSDGAATARTVVELSQVTFMDSSGINALIGAHHAATARRGWVRVAAPTPSILRVLRIVGLDTVITCYPTLQQALTLDPRDGRTAAGQDRTEDPGRHPAEDPARDRPERPARPDHDRPRGPAGDGPGGPAGG